MVRTTFPTPPETHLKTHSTNISKAITWRRHHCIDRRLSHSELKWLIDRNIKTQRKQKTEGGYMSWYTVIDWDDLTAQFNAEFGKARFTKKQLICMVNITNNDFWKSYTKMYMDLKGKNKKRKA